MLHKLEFMLSWWLAHWHMSWQSYETDLIEPAQYSRKSEKKIQNNAGNLQQAVEGKQRINLIYDGWSQQISAL